MTHPLEPHTGEGSSDPSIQPLLRSLAIEMIIYAPLVILYFLIVLRFAGQYLTDLYNSSTNLYAFTALAAIVAQGVLLERLTTWLLHRFGLRK